MRVALCHLKHSLIFNDIVIWKNAITAHMLVHVAFYWKISSTNIAPFFENFYLACIVVVVEVIGKATRSERRKKGFFSRSDKSSLVWNLLVKYIRIRHTFPRFYLSPVHSEIFWVEIVWSCNTTQFSKIMLITPARTHSISGLKSPVLKLPFLT